MDQPTARVVPDAATAQTREAVVNPHNLAREAPIGELFYRAEWMGVPPDVAAYGYFTRGVRQVMEKPPQFYQTRWGGAQRYSKL